MSYADLYDEAQKSKRTEQLTAEYVAFDEEGKAIVGKLMGVNEVSSKSGGPPYNQYLFDTDSGLIKCAFGRATDGEAGALMRIGLIYAVEYLGTDSITGGRRVNRFNIERVLMPDESPTLSGDPDES